MTLRESAKLQRGYSGHAFFAEAANMLLRGRGTREVVLWLRNCGLNAWASYDYNGDCIISVR